ncbi:MAG: PD-(D/E)XK nuclease domain-containing protein, partial [Thiotrichaceae bacterium]|nr:PD-(D/E)XK nuclease domain-containing protein [Thiotrichaceae bacterium]
KLKTWYNGYNFLADPIYNPFDVLLYLRNKEFRSYWFETGTPTFLVDLIYERQLDSVSLDNIQISDMFMGSFDVDSIEPEPLLFQTGYLTIAHKETFPAGIRYTLTFPNHEVRHAFHGALLNKFGQTGPRQDKYKNRLLSALQDGDMDALRDIFQAFFASIPNDWYRKNSLSDFEGYYCSVVYSYFVATGLDVRPEDATSHGRIDMSVLYGDKVFIIEFKVNELSKSGSALAQIKEKRYAEKYSNKNIWLIGAEFSKEERNISRFDWEQVHKLST